MERTNGWKPPYATRHEADEGDEATRNENIGCAALVERMLQRTYPMDSAYEPIVAAIRARIARDPVTEA